MDWDAKFMQLLLELVHPQGRRAVGIDLAGLLFLDRPEVVDDRAPDWELLWANLPEADSPINR